MEQEWKEQVLLRKTIMGKKDALIQKLTNGEGDGYLEWLALKEEERSVEKATLELLEQGVKTASAMLATALQVGTQGLISAIHESLPEEEEVPKPVMVVVEQSSPVKKQKTGE